ncbi:MAG: hypothetical protein ACXAC2_12940, partial [Candidatus Kariarchaeaceae archaeon]
SINEIGQEAGLVATLPFALFGFILLFATGGDKIKSLVKPFLPVWIILSLGGLVIFALNSLLPETFTVSTYGLGFIFLTFSLGLVYKALSYEYVPSLPMASMRGVSSGKQSQGNMDDANIIQKASVEEATVYLTIQKKSIENSMTQVQNAFRSGRLSQAFYNSVSSSYQGKISGFDDQIASLKVSSKRSTRKSIFEEELGIKKAAPPAQQPVSQPKPSAPAPQAPPSGLSPPAGPPQVAPSAGPPKPAPSSSPPPTPSGPPIPPGIPPAGVSRPSGPPTPPGLPTPSPSKAPSPPGMPTPSPAGPPAPPGAGPPPLPGAQSPGAAPGPDVVGSARSTSIAELRGEMLKELRRLRDIFKEDQ